MIALAFWALLLQAPWPSPPAGAAENVPFKICQQSFFWTRPSEAVQAKIWNDPRYQGLGGSKSREWTHYFFLEEPESASISYHQQNVTGMWTAGFAHDVQRLCDAGEGRQLGNGEQAEVWVLLHEVKAIQRQGEIYTVIVRPVEKGFQTVDFLRPGDPRKNLTVIFVNPEGQELDRVVEQGRERESFSGRVIGVDQDEVTVDTPEGMKKLAVSPKTTIWKGGAVPLEVIEPGDSIYGTGVAQPDGRLAALQISANRASLTGFVESSSPGKIRLAPAAINGKRRGPTIEVAISPDTRINGGKGKPEYLQRGLYVMVVGAERRDGSVQAADIMLPSSQPPPEVAAAALEH